jgi:4-amino-4-deoxy-L-arabinose transferase-like glycosyltransferase
MLSPLHFLQTCWRMRPLTAIAVLAAVALPWYLWVHERTQGAWTAGFFLEHNFGRAMQPMEGHKGIAAICCSIRRRWRSVSFRGRCF